MVAWARLSLKAPGGCADKRAMAESTRSLWDTVVARSARLLVAEVLMSAVAGAAVLWLGGSTRLFLVIAALGLAAVLVAWLRPGSSARLFRGIMYHSDDDGLVVAPQAGGLTRLPWDSIVELRESPWGGLVLATRESQVLLPRCIARRDSFGTAAFQRVVPRLAGDLWEGLSNGRMVAICPERGRPVLTVVLGLAIGVSLVLPGGILWGLATLVGGLVLFMATRSRTRSVFLSARGIGDRDRFIGWDAAELHEHRWSLVVRDPDSGWVVRIPRRVANYQAIAVVASAAQALSGSGVEAVAFRSAQDSGRIRILVEGNLPEGGLYH